MRQKVCKTCKSKFLPARSDAEFCSSRCRQASYRDRQKNNAAEAAEELFHQKEQNAHDAAQAFENYLGFSSMLNDSADVHGIQNVEFVGIPDGVLAIEKTPGAIKLAMARDDWPHGRDLRSLRETEGLSSEILAMLPPPMLGGSFIQREREKQLRDDLLKNPARKVSLFQCRDATLPWLFWFDVPEMKSLPVYWDENGFDDEFLDQKDLLPGSGDQVLKS
jgi:hypothetical protein